MKTNKQKCQRIQHQCDQWLSKEDAIRQMAAKSLSKVTKPKNRRSFPMTSAGAFQLEIGSTPLKITATKQTSIQNFFSKPKAKENTGKSYEEVPSGDRDNQERSYKYYDEDEDHFKGSASDLSEHDCGDKTYKPNSMRNSGTLDSSDLKSPTVYLNSRNKGSLRDYGCVNQELGTSNERKRTRLQPQSFGLQCETGTKDCSKKVSKHFPLRNETSPNSEMETLDSDLSCEDSCHSRSLNCGGGYAVNTKSQLSACNDLSPKSLHNSHQEDPCKSRVSHKRRFSPSNDFSASQLQPSTSTYGPPNDLSSDISLSQDSIDSDIFMSQNSESISQKMRQFDQDMRLIYSKFKKPSLDVLDLMSSESESCD